MLQVIAYSDSISYVWMPPAGYTRGLVTNASNVGYIDAVSGNFKTIQLNQGQRDVLYNNNINPIAYIPNRGLVVYGQKTRDANTTAMDRVNVSRLVNYLRYYFDIIAKPFLFELNTTNIRQQVTTVFNTFLTGVMSSSGVYDFIVVCDTTNNTPSTIDANELWIDIAIQPAKAIEFIYIPLRLVNTGTDMGSLYNGQTAAS
jgi:phage tail sheath protein FI